MKDRTHPVYRYILGVPVILLIAALCGCEVMIPVTVGGRVIPGLWLISLLLLAGLCGIQETLRLMRRIGSDPPSGVVYLSGTLILLAPYLPVILPEARVNGIPWDLFAILAILVSGSLAVILAQMGRYPGPESNGATLRGILGGVFTIFYVPLLLCFTAMILLDPRMGVGVLGGMILLVKSGDMGAYFFGRLFGKRGTNGLPVHPMSPVLSPKKSMEGLGGAVLVPVIVMILIMVVLDQFPAQEAIFRETIPYHRAILCLLAAVLGLVGMYGDLAESLLKREAGVKDSSEWLPGFGGVLDMIDSVLFAAPVTYGILWITDVLR
ncbi:MAG: phosphatidate cytidylyltransferase [Planctomycetia bacterium]|nr:phosphatidate cytidylyltransferase [Planctomycetia bacterium]